MANAQINRQEALTQQVFSSLMWAFSYPGREHLLPGSNDTAFLAIAETLIDLETSYYTPDPALGDLLAHLGSTLQSPEQARYQFYPVINQDTLDLLSQAPVGTYASPDDSASLVIGCVIGSGTLLELTGPGIKTTTSLQVDGIPGEFWKLREEKCFYPMGWDIFLVSGNRVVGLPRTTRLEVK